MLMKCGARGCNAQQGVNGIVCAAHWSKLHHKTREYLLTLQGQKPSEARAAARDLTQRPLRIALEWLAPAFRAGRLTGVRRILNKEQSASFKKGRYLYLTDRQWGLGATLLGIARVSTNSFWQSTSAMNEVDYEEIGLLYFEDNQDRWTTKETPAEYFERQKAKKQNLCVIQFDPVAIFDPMFALKEGANA